MAWKRPKRDASAVESYRRRLRGHEELVHLTIETQLCRDHDESSGRP